MIASLAGGLGELVKRPLFFVPALIGMGLNMAIFLFTIDNYFGFFYEVFFLGNVPNAGISELPFYIFVSYFWDVLAICLAVFLSLFIGYFILYTYAALVAKKDKGVAKAISSTVPRATEILALTAFTFAAFFLYTAVAFMLFAGTVSSGGLGVVAFALMIVWLAFGVYAFLKLLFAPLFMAVGKKKLKQALSESWKWSAGRLITIIALLVALSMVAGAINAVFGAISDATDAEAISVIALVLGSALSGAYYNIVLVKYFVESA